MTGIYIIGAVWAVLALVGVVAFLVETHFAPTGFECDRCGFLRGTSHDEQAHRRAHDVLDAIDRGEA